MAKATSTKTAAEKKASTNKAAIAKKTHDALNGPDILDLALAENETAGEVIVPDTSIPGSEVGEINTGSALELAESDINSLAALLDGEGETVSTETSLLDSLLDDGIAASQAASEITLGAATDAPQVDTKPATPKKDKAPATPRPAVSAKTSEKIAHRLGDKVGDYLILETSDAGLSAEQLQKVQQKIMADLDATNQIKVREKMVQLFGYMRNGGKLNEVMRRAFTTLIKEGQLTSGDKGNLQLELLKKPYSLGTARAQAGQIFSLFPTLKIVVKSDRGIYKANEESTILAFMKNNLSL